ncbi:MAG: hypothetical protein COB30_010755 [Ectothiorhodospiraceae bacterium]|nr:hypothetical protein [Ectothiorhodospiraceae bacterium]
MKKIIIILVFLVCIFPLIASAGWYKGSIIAIAYGYDGKTIAFRISDGSFTKTDCTCSTWTNYMCLDSTRGTHNAEISLLLSTHATRKPLAVNIDETSCKVRALEVYQ